MNKRLIDALIEVAEAETAQQRFVPLEDNINWLAAQEIQRLHDENQALRDEVNRLRCDKC